MYNSQWCETNLFCENLIFSWQNNVKYVEWNYKINLWSGDKIKIWIYREWRLGESFIINSLINGPLRAWWMIVAYDVIQALTVEIVIAIFEYIRWHSGFITVLVFGTRADFLSFHYNKERIGKWWKKKRFF